MSDYILELKGLKQCFKHIPAGEFLMGSPEDEVFRHEDETQHLVQLDAYWLADTTVTQALYKAVTGENPSHFKGDDLPVDSVSWDDTQKFITALNELTGKAFCLPTEAQWECACRAGTKTPFAFGNTINQAQVNFDGNYYSERGASDRYRAKTVAVEVLPPNTWGLYQMHGNVWEWCQDWYSKYESDSTTTPLINPIGREENKCRVLRGGSWYNTRKGSRSALRNWMPPYHKQNNCGFRLCLNKI